MGIGPATALGKTKDHFGELDGLRGAAAFIVMLAHFFYFFFSMREDNPTTSMIASSPLSILFNGEYCVGVFFTLSGFVLAHATTRGRLGFLPLVVKRYVRLTLPIAASTGFALILIWLGLGTDTYRAQFGAEVVNYFPAGFEPTLWYWAFESTIRVYLKGEAHLNGVLWTMQVELIGSIVVFALFSFVHFRGLRLAVNAVAAVVLFLVLGKHNTLQGLQLFCCGMIFYDLWPRIQTLRKTRGTGDGLGLILLAFGLAAAGWWVKEPVLPSIAPLFDLLSPLVRVSRYEAWQLGAALTVLGVLLSPLCARLLSSPAFRFLGLISFPLYLVHASIEIMVTGHLVLLLRDFLPMPALIAVTGVVNIALCFAMAFVFLRLVEAPSIRLSAKVGSWQPSPLFARWSPRS